MAWHPIGLCAPNAVFAYRYVFRALAPRPDHISIIHSAHFRRSK